MKFNVAPLVIISDKEGAPLPDQAAECQFLHIEGYEGRAGNMLIEREIETLDEVFEVRENLEKEIGCDVGILRLQVFPTKGEMPPLGYLFEPKDLQNLPSRRFEDILKDRMALFAVTGQDSYTGLMGSMLVGWPLPFQKDEGELYAPGPNGSNLLDSIPVAEFPSLTKEAVDENIGMLWDNDRAKYKAIHALQVAIEARIARIAELKARIAELEKK